VKRLAILLATAAMLACAGRVEAGSWRLDGLEAAFALADWAHRSVAVDAVVETPAEGLTLRGGAGLATWNVVDQDWSALSVAAGAELSRRWPAPWVQPYLAAGLIWNTYSADLGESDVFPSLGYTAAGGARVHVGERWQIGSRLGYESSHVGLQFGLTVGVSFN
jgi:hypothetical protein